MRVSTIDNETIQKRQSGGLLQRLKFFYYIKGNSLLKS